MYKKSKLTLGLTYSRTPNLLLGALQAMSPCISNSWHLAEELTSRGPSRRSRTPAKSSFVIQHIWRSSGHLSTQTSIAHSATDETGPHVRTLEIRRCQESLPWRGPCSGAGHPKEMTEENGARSGHARLLLLPVMHHTKQQGCSVKTRFKQHHNQFK